jgi:hypothetical protein
MTLGYYSFALWRGEGRFATRRPSFSSFIFGLLFIFSSTTDTKVFLLPTEQHKRCQLVGLAEKLKWVTLHLGFGKVRISVELSGLVGVKAETTKAES